MRTCLILALVLTLTAMSGCGLLPEYVADTGTVLYVGVEGGFYGITDDHGRHWDVSGLPSDLAVDGLRVRFVALVTDLASTHMWGRTAELLSVERLE